MKVAEWQVGGNQTKSCQSSNKGTWQSYTYTIYYHEILSDMSAGMTSCCLKYFINKETVMAKS